MLQPCKQTHVLSPYCYVSCGATHKTAYMCAVFLFLPQQQKAHAEKPNPLQLLPLRGCSCPCPCPCIESWKRKGVDPWRQLIKDVFGVALGLPSPSSSSLLFVLKLLFEDQESLSNKMSHRLEPSATMWNQVKLPHSLFHSWKPETKQRRISFV